MTPEFHHSKCVYKKNQWNIKLYSTYRSHFLRFSVSKDESGAYVISWLPAVCSGSRGELNSTQSVVEAGFYSPSYTKTPRCKWNFTRSHCRGNSITPHVAGLEECITNALRWGAEWRGRGGGGGGICLTHWPPPPHWTLPESGWAFCPDHQSLPFLSASSCTVASRGETSI